jgi:hypothetical protein
MAGQSDGVFDYWAIFTRHVRLSFAWRLYVGEHYLRQIVVTIASYHSTTKYNTDRSTIPYPISTRARYLSDVLWLKH